MENRSIEALEIINNRDKYQDDSSRLLQAIKYIKNTIIGNTKKKLEFIDNGAIALFINLLLNEKNQDILIQVTCVLGSFSCKLERGALDICKTPNALDRLISLLSHDNQKMVESSARTIKFILGSKPQNSNHHAFNHINSFIYGAEGIRLLTSLLKHNESIQETAIIIIGQGCEPLINNRREELNTYQTQLLKSGAFDSIFSFLAPSKSKLQEQCLVAVELLTRDNATVCQHLVNRSPDYVELRLIVHLAKSQSPRTKLLAATIICNIDQTKCLPPPFSPVMTKLLPMIVRLMSPQTCASPTGTGHESGSSMMMNGSDTIPAGGSGGTSNNNAHLGNIEEEQSIREDIPAFLARVVSESEELQRVAAECESLIKLVGYIRDRKSSNKLLENALTAIAVLCSTREDSRRQVAESKAIPIIVQLLDSSQPSIKAAACRCIKSLSRSIKQLRTFLYDSAVGQPFPKLIVDPSLEVRVNALASICNLVIDFSPMKQEMIDSGVMKKLVEYLLDGQCEHQVRLNSAWALKNMLFMADVPIKEALLKEISLDNLATLTRETNPAISEQILSLFRNLLYKDSTNIITDEHGLLLIRLVEQLINNPTYSTNDAVIKQALFVVCNLASNKEIHRNQIITSPIFQKIIYYLENSNNHEIKITSIWCLTNLVKFEDITKEQRIKKIRDNGCIDIVNMMVEGSNEDLKIRSKELLKSFSQN
ncbi:armadillo repeat-containing protein [Cavenderia fasciculata]|uniref:Armadillo repeat-containing protein n=1 Tax=Cavenderia fasciculata TaxID=261658 RepID=F4Q8S2_CACFS|nr:armadillo repeat-containing protein [Cavenderia fasciculata]EGG15091.1 armadillo repeat-containing protein [Cavenderia fasciculata]|eukprot:XP_004351811.1 armadillo repeat-containing protein [Cavenderia fasciculata]